MKPFISLCLIAKNEGKNLYQCLNSVSHVVDEIVVIDTGSTDDTLEIAKNFGARVQNFLWNNNFSDARNVALDLANGEWILIMDADEKLEKNSAMRLRDRLKENLAEGYFLKIINYIGGDDWQECCPDLVFRLFKNDCRYRFHGAIHEQIVDVITKVNSKANFEIADDVVLEHFGYLNQQIEAKDKKNRNLTILKSELAKHPNDQLLLYHYGVELYRCERYNEAAQVLIHASNGLSPQTIYYPKLLRYIVMAYYEEHNFLAALQTVEQGLKVYPDYLDLTYYGGLISYEIADYNKAYMYFKQTLNMPAQPSYYAGFSGLRGFRSYYYLGRIAEKFCNEEAALAFYLEALRDNPSYWGSLERIIIILNPRKFPEETQVALEKICEFCTPEAYLRMANLLFSQSAFVLAFKYFERGMENNLLSSSPTLLWKAICLIQQQRSLEALSILNEFDAADSLYPLAKLNELLCFWLEGNKKKCYIIANSLFALGLNKDTGTVVSLFQDSSEKNLMTIDLEEDGMKLLLNIVERIVALGYKEKAALLLARLSEKSLIIYAESIGNMYLSYEQFAEAESYFKLCVNKCSGNDAAWFNLGEAKLGQNLAIEALLYYKRALAINRKEPKYYIKIIDICENLAMQAQDDVKQQFSNVDELLSNKEC